MGTYYLLLTTWALLLTPYSLLLTPYYLLPTPYSLLLTPYSLLPTPYSLLPTPYSLPPFSSLLPPPHFLLTPSFLLPPSYSLLPSYSFLLLHQPKLLCANLIDFRGDCDGRCAASLCGDCSALYDLGFASDAPDTLPEWSKGVDSSSTSASCVGSNPTGVTYLFWSWSRSNWQTLVWRE